nr:VOC family protein [Pseudarthrobacter sp. NamE2]
MDIAVEELDSTADAAIAVGVTVAAHQTASGQWRMLLDPADHPLCLTVVRPD